MLFAIASCQEEHELGSKLDTTDLKFSVTQDQSFDNKIFLNGQTEQTISFWDYFIGTSNQNIDTVIIPFPGNFWIKYSALGRAGSVTDSAMVTVTKIDNSYFEDPKWKLLTNLVDGKTWILDMSAPMGWAGLGYPSEKADNWNWFPTYAEASWTMDNKDWGQMTFDLNGNFNVSVTQTALKSDEQKTRKGTFSYDIKNGRLKFNKTEMLYGGDYYPDVSNWTDVKVLELTETSLRLMVIRDQSRTGEGKCFIMFHFKPKT